MRSISSASVPSQIDGRGSYPGGFSPGRESRWPDFGGVRFFATNTLPDGGRSFSDEATRVATSEPRPAAGEELPYSTATRNPYARTPGHSHAAGKRPSAREL